VAAELASLMCGEELRVHRTVRTSGESIQARGYEPKEGVVTPSSCIAKSSGPECPNECILGDSETELPGL